MAMGVLLVVLQLKKMNVLEQKYNYYKSSLVLRKPKFDVVDDTMTP